MSEDGKAVYARQEISGLSPNWKRCEVTLKTGRVVPTAKAYFTRCGWPNDGTAARRQNCTSAQID
jgi:hypothetical protein